MDSSRKNILLFSGIALTVAIVCAIVIISLAKKNKEEKAEIEKQIKNQQAKQDDGYIRPKVNRNGELINPASEIIGQVAIAKKDPTTLRNSAMVDNPTQFAPFDNNILTAVNKGTTIGKIIGVVKGPENPAMNWLKIKLPKPIIKVDAAVIPQTFGLAYLSSLMSSDNAGNNPMPTDICYVRSDVATFKPYKK